MTEITLVGACIVGITITSIVVYQKYKEAIEEKELNDQFETEKGVRYAFSRKDNPQELLIKVIDNAEQKLDLAIFSITAEGVVNRIINATERGVKVRLLTDKRQSKTKSQKKAIDKLLRSNIPIKVNKHSGFMHLKVTIADEKVFTTGSYNYSYNGAVNNDDVIVVIEDLKLTEEWSNHFENLWEQGVYIRTTPLHFKSA